MVPYLFFSTDRLPQTHSFNGVNSLVLWVCVCLCVCVDDRMSHMCPIQSCSDPDATCHRLLHFRIVHGTLSNRIYIRNAAYNRIIFQILFSRLHCLAVQCKSWRFKTNCRRYIYLSLCSYKSAVTGRQTNSNESKSSWLKLNDTQSK